MFIFMACQNSNLTGTGQTDEIVSIIQAVFAALFPVAQSPFVAAALIEILTDFAEKSVEVGIKGMSWCMYDLKAL